MKLVIDCFPSDTDRVYDYFSSILEELRIKHGQVKEKLREKSKQCDLLDEKLRQKNESQKEVGRLKNELTKGQLRCEELQNQLKKLEAANR